MANKKTLRTKKTTQINPALFVIGLGVDHAGSGIDRIIDTGKQTRHP